MLADLVKNNETLMKKKNRLVYYVGNFEKSAFIFRRLFDFDGEDQKRK